MSAPLVERDHVIEDLDRQLATAVTGTGRLVLLAGMAGIGKTSVVRALAERTRPPVRVLWGACDAAATPRPFGPFHDMADDLPVLDLQAPRHEMFSAVLAELRTRRMLMIVEDVHWADEATLDLLVHLGRRIDRTRTLLVATYRAEEIGRGHPLRAVLGTLATAPGHRRRSLSPLSREAIATLVGDRSVDAERLHRVTGGNPFFVTEVLATPGWVVPPTVADAVRARARRLGPGAREVLDAVSVDTRPVAISDLVALGHRPRDVDAAVEGGMLVVDGQRVAFRHELARLAILDALAPTVRRALHAAWLALFEGRDGVEPARLALHAIGSGDETPARRWSVRAAAEAAASGAHREAAAHYGDAVARAADLPTAARADLLEALAREQSLLDRRDDALATWRQVLELRREVPDPAGVVAARAQVARSVWSTGDGPAARRIMASAVDAATQLEPGRIPAAVLAGAAYLAMLARQGDQAQELAARALELARPTGFDDVVVEALNALGSAVIVGGDVAGIAPLEESRALATSHGWDAAVEDALNNLGSALGEIRRHDLAPGYLQQAIDFSRERDLDGGYHYSTAWLARVRFEQGRWDEALALATDLPTTGGVSPITSMVSLTTIGRIRVRRGEPVGDVLDRAWEQASRSNDLQRTWPTAAARAEAAWLAGTGTEQLLDDLAGVLEQALELDVAWAIGETAFWLDRLGRPVGVLAGAAEPWALQLAGDHVAAAAVWEAIGAPYEQAWALADAGDEPSLRAALELLMGLGATPLAGHVRSRLRELGASNIPARPRSATRAHPAGLTARQAEVLDLVAAGLTDRQIAERLFISPKTVGHHVSAVLAKLEVDSRTAAATLAHERGWLTGEPATPRP